MNERPALRTRIYTLSYTYRNRPPPLYPALARCRSLAETPNISTPYTLIRVRFAKYQRRRLTHKGQRAKRIPIHTDLIYRVSQLPVSICRFIYIYIYINIHTKRTFLHDLSSTSSVHHRALSALARSSHLTSLRYSRIVFHIAN